MSDLRQQQTLQPQIPIENAELWAALQAEIAARGGEKIKTNGLEHAVLVEIILEALTEKLLPS
jgi:hypothetical protein